MFNKFFIICIMIIDNNTINNNVIILIIIMMIMIKHVHVIVLYITRIKYQVINNKIITLVHHKKIRHSKKRINIL